MNDARVQITDILTCQDYLNELYRNVNSYLDHHYMFGYLTRHTGWIAKSLFYRSRFAPTYEIDERDYLMSLSWLFAIANSLNIDAGDAFIRKIPGFCGYCLEAPCVCLETGKKPKKPMRAYKIEEERRYGDQGIRHRITSKQMPLVFDYATSTLRAVYPNNLTEWKAVGPQTHLIKLLEELAELQEKLCKFSCGEVKIGSVGEEIADIFAWICGAWAIVFPGQTLEDAFIDYYSKGCPVCEGAPCKCPKGSDRFRSVVDFRVFETIIVKLVELRDILPGDKNEVAELIKSAEAAKEYQTEALSKQAVNETDSTLEKIKQKVGVADEIGKKCHSIINTIKAMLAVLKDVNIPF